MRFLQRLVWVSVMENPRLATQQEGQCHIIRTLFHSYLKAIRAGRDELLPRAFLPGFGLADEIELPFGPKQLIERFSNQDLKVAQVRLAADIVASFSDREAFLLYRRISGTAPGSVTDVVHG